MILPVLLALPAALGLLLQGAQPGWAKALVCATAGAGAAFWLCVRGALGYIPRPSGRNLLWTSALALLGGASFAFSSPSAPASAWCVFLVALGYFPIMACASKDERAAVDFVLRVCAWVLMVLAFYQRLRLGEAVPASTLSSPEAYAGALLLLLPLAAEQRDWLLAAGLAVNFIWCGSIGAWTGLACALVVTRLRRKDAAFWLGACAGLACAVCLYGQLQSEPVLARLASWKTAVQAMRDHPLFGTGPGALSGDGSMYVLRAAAEYGIVFAAIWFAGLWSCVLRGASYKRFGALAVFVQSFWDGVFLMPVNLWLFAYFASSSLTEENRGAAVPSRFRPAVCAAAAASGCGLAYAAFRLWTSGAA